MTTASALEQQMLEKVNAERAKVGAQPLAFNGDLNESAEIHSDWMLDTDIFSHTGAGGSNAGQRMTAAGYTFTGSWTWGENIAWQSERGATGYADDIDNLHTAFMNSPGHKANILKADFKEIGIGFLSGNMNGWTAGMVTQNFAKSGTGSFITGVAWRDADGDRSYDAGEGLSGLTVRVTSSSGAVLTQTTADAGGYGIKVADGTYTVTISNGSQTVTKSVTVAGQNVKVDFLASAGGSTTGGGGGDGNIIKGTGGNDTINGTSGSDELRGFEGNDKLSAGAGNDVLKGGAGTDVLRGGSGEDQFYFSAGQGRDRVSDFSFADDVIDFSAFDLSGRDEVTFSENTGGHLMLSVADISVVLIGHDLSDAGDVNILL